MTQLYLWYCRTLSITIRYQPRSEAIEVVT